LAAGETIFVPAGHGVSAHSVGFYAQDAEQSGLLARAQDIQNLEREVRSQSLMAEESRAALGRAEQAYADAAQRLTGLRSHAQEAQALSHRLQVELLRLSQLAPTDLRGLPVVADGVSRWFPPEFLPTSGKGILFLDEINMAPPVMQGIAQQLILDRKVGSYCVPEGWFIWASGNRKSDRAAVFDMPSALANRFIHLELAPDLDSFKAWGLTEGISEQVLAFLAFRPSLLHQIDPQRAAWPSPRSWAMADRLHGASLSIEPAVGPGAAGEFEAFCTVYSELPDLASILKGISEATFPTESSARYATVLGLIVRCENAEQSVNSLVWLVRNAGGEWVQFFVSDLFRIMRERGQFGDFTRRVSANCELKDFARSMRDLIFIS
jgi:hypothetical protein